MSLSSSRSLPHAFFAVAERTPMQTALHTGAGARIAYRDLASRVRGLKGALRAAGVRRGDRVAVCFEGGPDRVVGVLGVLAAGAAFVPIDPRHLGPRVDEVLTRTEVTRILCDPALRTRLGPRASALSALTGPEEAPHEAVGRTDLAYVIHTSGTGGAPKGVGVEHGAVLALAESQAKAFDVRADDSVLQFASPAFDAFVAEVFTTLLSGATLRVATNAELEPGPNLTRTLAEVGMVTLPPSLWAVLDPGQAPQLRVAISAGEPCPPSVVDRWAPGRLFIDAYGPTEATVCATAGERRPEDTTRHVGAALDGVEVYVLDSRGRRALPGMKGEVFIGGRGVSRGYWRAPRRTADRFVPDPFSKAPGARMYRTGDFGRWQSGRLVLLGRKDRQLQVLGHRVEPEEIEAQLCASTEVVAAAVVGAHLGTPEAHLVAHVVSANAEASSQSILAQLEAKVPSYLRPRRIVFHEQLPLTSSGKVDCAALEALPAPTAVRVAPRTQTEIALAQIWCEMLSLPAVGVTDDFFALGGQSVQAVRLVARIEEIFGRSLPMSELLEERTIAHLASVLDASGPRRRANRGLVRLQSEGRGAPVLMCHALGGRALTYLALSRALGTARPVWGLESPRLDGPQPSEHSPRLEALGESLAGRVADATEGVEAVVGWSFGAVLALELTRAMERRGRAPRLLVMLDPGPTSSMDVDGGDLLEMVAGFAARAQLPMDTEALVGRPRLDQIEEMERQLELHVPATIAKTMRAELRTAAAHIEARGAYALGDPIETPVLLVATKPPPEVEAPLALTVPSAWAGVTTGSFEPHVVEAEHGGLIEAPHVFGVAKLISQALEKTK